MKTKKTNRKFYNKWLYKISLRLQSAAAFRIYSLDEIKNVCKTFNKNKTRSYFLENIPAEKDHIENLVDIFENTKQSIWGKRIERNCLDIYTNDKQFYLDISTKFEEIVIHRFEPANETAIEQLGNQSILVKKLPHNKFQYRVYLLPHKMGNYEEDKKRYVEWLKSQSPRITCTPAVESWFIKTHWNWDRRYVLVEDEKTLLMLKLRNSEVVGKVYKFEIADK